MTAPSYTELKSFFVNNELSQKAADSIKDGKEIALTVAGKAFRFTKVKGQNVLEEGPASKPDVAFDIPEASAQDLISKKFDSVGQVGLYIFEQIMSNDPQRKIHIKLHTGFLGLMGSGYLGVLTSGGTEVAKFLASRGLGNLGKLKDTISKLKA